MRQLSSVHSILRSHRPRQLRDEAIRVNSVRFLDTDLHEEQLERQHAYPLAATRPSWWSSCESHVRCRQLFLAAACDD